ncbi:MAG: tetratricopeptide repeat protein [Myxococcota bacterium]
MRLFKRGNPYDRVQVLAAASKAHSRGKTKKALQLYLQVLGLEPENAELHRKVAPLLARRKRHQEAWESFRFAANSLVQDGFLEKAIAVYREALHFVPSQPAAWLAIANLHQQRERPADAIHALLEGRSHLRKRRDRPAAIHLLSSVREIDPHHFAACLDLARLYAQRGDRRGGMALLEGLLRRAHRAELRRIRALQVRIRPTPAALVRWLRALFFGH